MKNKNLYFIHGWGFDSNFWVPLFRELKKNIENSFEISFFNFGYFNKPFYPKIKEKNKQNKNFFITHSFGYNWLLKNFNYYDGLINFCGSSKYFCCENIKVQKQINEMIKMLKIDPEIVLKKFYINSGIRNYRKDKLINTELLIESLNILKNENLERLEKINNSPKLNIYCSEDKILNIKNLTKSKNDVIINGDHCLPFKSPKKTSKIILNFLREHDEL